MALCNLIQSPDVLAQALTDDLGPDNRVKAMKRLCATWNAGLREDRDTERGAIRKIAACGVWFEKNKGKRNQIIHYCWMRSSDEEIIGWKHNTRPHFTEEKYRARAIKFRTTELTQFAREITLKADELLGLVQEIETLPPWPKTLPPPPLPEIDI